jgi:phenylpropionate dioxygenase-like ring-hydroxylating dioxygenase large terminal subunit
MPAAGTRHLWLLLSLVSSAALAHHSPALLYDLSREIEISGTVTEFNMGNPHLRIYLDVDMDGKTERWMAEGGSRTVLLRAGWDGTELTPGDRITVRGHPSRDGSNVIHLQYLILPDGTEKFGEDLDRSRLERLRQER